MGPGVVLALVLSLAGCGFHLRGDNPYAAALARTRVHLQTGGAPVVQGALMNALDGFSVPLAAQPSEADLVLNLQQENIASRVVSFDPRTGKAREFEIVYRVVVSATDPAGAPVLVEEALEFQRDYTFDDAAVLGAFAQEQAIRAEIARDAADTILRRLMSVGQPAPQPR
jgi:LPS-assembly lipoprotein